MGSPRIFLERILFFYVFIYLVMQFKKKMFLWLVFSQAMDLLIKCLAPDLYVFLVLLLFSHAFIIFEK